MRILGRQPLKLVHAAKEDQLRRLTATQTLRGQTPLMTTWGHAGPQERTDAQQTHVRGQQRVAPVQAP